jgi:hypothetical protein
MRRTRRLAAKIGTFAIDQEVACVVAGDHAESFLPKEQAGPIHELAGWSWGGFLLPWVWGPANGVKSSLLALIPPLAPFVAFRLGHTGNRLAWQGRQWQDPERFHAVQRAWASLGLLSYTALGAIIAVLAATGLFSGGRPTQAMYATPHLSAPASVNMRLAPIPVTSPDGAYSIMLPSSWETDPAAAPSLAARPFPELGLPDVSLHASHSDQPYDVTLASMRMALSEQGGKLTSEKQVLPAATHILLTFRFVDASIGQAKYRQVLIVAASAGTITATTEVPEPVWPRLEAVLEKSLRTLTY